MLSLKHLRWYLHYSPVETRTCWFITIKLSYVWSVVMYLNLFFFWFSLLYLVTATTTSSFFSWHELMRCKWLKKAPPSVAHFIEHWVPQVQCLQFMFAFYPPTVLGEAALWNGWEKLWQNGLFPCEAQATSSVLLGKIFDAVEVADPCQHTC